MIPPFAERVVKKALRLLRRVGNVAQRGVMAGKIALKWFRDKGDVPLTADHRELYFIIHRLCRHELGEFPELVHCRDYNDKIQWLKLFDQREEIVRCSDKVLVRGYIRERVGEKYLVKLYQVHDHFSQIDFDVLPKAFVIKTNHDSGTVILVRDKSKLDRKAAEERIEEALKQPYGWSNGEWAYSYVRPQILVEEFLDPQSDVAPPDYKFHCVEGKIRWLQFIFDRGQETKEVIVNEEGAVMSIHFDHKMHHRESFRLPLNWSEMKSVVERLAAGFRYVRVDVYGVNGHIYVGEMTFYPLMGCYKGEGQKILGAYLDFDRGTFNPVLIPELERIHSRFMLYPQQ